MFETLYWFRLPWQRISYWWVISLPLLHDRLSNQLFQNQLFLDSIEEKFDDSYCRFSSGCSPSRVGNENSIPVQFRSGGAYFNRNSKGLGAIGNLLREFTSFLHHPEQHSGEISSIEPCQTASADVDQVVRDAVISLTEIRPPSDFVLYPDGVVIHTSSDTEGTLAPLVSTYADDVEMTELSLEQRLPSGPPIFDGTVANATPNFSASVGGGTGTALHAVAALDHPLTLALLLVMGADARACHTAFRRLVQHEAACNGSIQCLTLLLELGNRFGEDQLSRKDCASTQQRNSNENVPATHSPEAVMDFPFFARRTSNGTHGTLSTVHSKSMQQWRKSGIVSDAMKVPSLDILSLLRLFCSLVKQVSSGSITELDAARILVQQATISDQTKAALAMQCGFDVRYEPISASINPYNRLSTNSNSSDGHGNTPLHWAAFKNESACVSLLLKYRADPNAKAFPSGWTPLHDAAYSNGREAIALLIDAGAIVDARASSGATPLCFAAQEDAAEAAELLLIRGADLGTRCAADPTPDNNNRPSELSTRPQPSQTRFSGYTPLHYCAHYNASRAAKFLLQHHSAAAAMEIRDLNDRLPIHVAVARGSSNVLRELLKAGARVETRALDRHHSSSSASPTRRSHRRRQNNAAARSAPSTPRRNNNDASPEPTETLSRPETPSTPQRNHRRGRSSSVSTAAPVSSPLLRSMIPSQPVQSSKPWNCLTQRSIDDCRQLISEVEQNWTPDRHSLFTPADRRAVAELLRVGKRLEAEGSLSFIDLWPEVLSFCGRGWFEVDQDDTEATDIDCLDEAAINGSNENLSLPTFC
jgi:ankyrin repeat protein